MVNGLIDGATSDFLFFCYEIVSNATQQTNGRTDRRTDISPKQDIAIQRGQWRTYCWKQHKGEYIHHINTPVRPMCYLILHNLVIFIGV